LPSYEYREFNSKELINYGGWCILRTCPNFKPPEEKSKTSSDQSSLNEDSSRGGRGKKKMSALLREEGQLQKTAAFMDSFFEQSALSHRKVFDTLDLIRKINAIQAELALVKTMIKFAADDDKKKEHMEEFVQLRQKLQSAAKKGDEAARSYETPISSKQPPNPVTMQSKPSSILSLPDEDGIIDVAALTGSDEDDDDDDDNDAKGDAESGDNEAKKPAAAMEDDSSVSSEESSNVLYRSIIGNDKADAFKRHWQEKKKEDPRRIDVATESTVIKPNGSTSKFAMLFAQGGTGPPLAVSAHHQALPYPPPNTEVANHNTLHHVNVAYMMA